MQVRGEDGTMKWKRVEVRPEEHIKVPIFPKTESLELYDKYFDEYMSRILMERTPQDKPLWEIHVIKYPTSNAAGTLIFKLHHALGDGYSLMGALLSCLRRADDPSLPLTFSFQEIITITNIIQERLLQVTINDVITGVIFYGVRLYMEEIDNKARTANSTGLVLLSTRNIGSYQSVQDMMKAVAKHIYGTLRNSSVVISNLIGPVEPMPLANHPVKGLYFTMSGGPESIDIAVMSYRRILRITLKTQKGFIDEQKFKLCMVKAFEDISRAAMEMPSKSKG
ncbi:O-acyltransferase, WSD1, N-terminal [Sesbania bispinosa]|nr:O-acyltransferase, WSD1, N-terminal [Sesbania bispinosa]